MTDHRLLTRPRVRAACRVVLIALACSAVGHPQAQQTTAQPLAGSGEPATVAAPADPSSPRQGAATPPVPDADAGGRTGATAGMADAGPRPIGQTTAPPAHDLSPWSMFLNADILVKGVMVGLALASVITWTILLAKSIELALARAGLARALARISGARTLTEAEGVLDGRRTVLARLVAAAADEVRLSQGSTDGIKERAASRCSEIVRAEGRTARRGMGALATIGAISPFVGLFGTVWGIMNSFIGISKAQTTNLAVVAPGIAEALLATAIGLVAAIPAVIIYNHFARATRGYGDLVQRASGAAMRLLSRDLDRYGEAARPVVFQRAAE